MPQSGVLKALKLLMVLGVWSLPVLAQAQAKPAAAPAAADTPAAAAQVQKAPAATPAPATAAPQAPATSATNPSSEYAGAQACQACHADIYTGWEKSPH